MFMLGRRAFRLSCHTCPLKPSATREFEKCGSSETEVDLLGPIIWRSLLFCLVESMKGGEKGLGGQLCCDWKMLYGKEL